MRDKNPYLAQEAVMTPNDICDFKRKWLMASYYQVFIHTDMRNRTKDWLKLNVPKHLHDVKTFTNVDEDCVRFENGKHFDQFATWYKESR